MTLNPGLGSLSNVYIMKMIVVMSHVAVVADYLQVSSENNFLLSFMYSTLIKKGKVCHTPTGV